MGRGLESTARMEPRRPASWWDALALAALLVILAGLYHPVTQLFWTHDDPFHIRYISSYSPAQYTFEPPVWRELPFRMFTPLQMVSYELDLALFGLHPELWYLHHLIALLLAAAVLFVVARAWLATLPAALLVLAMLFGPAINQWVELLMARQYIEGLVLAGLSAVAVQRYAATSKKGWLSAAAVAYLAAAACKEIYAVLPLCCVFIPAERRRRTEVAVSLLGTLAIYVAWRSYMLGTLLGGYGWAVSVTDVPGLLATLPGKLAMALAGDTGAGYALLAATLVLGATLAVLRPRVALLGLAALLLAVLPFLPVSTVFEPRYAVPAWLVLAALAAAGSEALGRRYRFKPELAMGGIVILALLANRLEWRRSFAESSRMSIEARYLWSSRDPAALRQPAMPPATSDEVRALRLQTVGTEAPAAFYDDLFLCHRPAVQTVVEFDPIENRISPRPALAERLRATFCSSIDQQAPLTASFRWQDDRLSWELGPYERGKYSLVLADGAVAHEVPRRASFHLGNAREIALRVKYEDRRVVTYSPELHLEASRPEQRWQRGDPPPG